jgi:hypothetical protein
MLKGTTLQRLAYRTMVGEIAPGLQIDHLCNTRSCANPKHLEAVTRAENQRRRAERSGHVCTRLRPSLYHKR